MIDLLTVVLSTKFDTKHDRRIYTWYTPWSQCFCFLTSFAEKIGVLD
jgi:hypothetical protein